MINYNFLEKQNYNLSNTHKSITAFRDKETYLQNKDYFINSMFNDILIKIITQSKYTSFMDLRINNKKNFNNFFKAEKLLKSKIEYFINNNNKVLLDKTIYSLFNPIYEKNKDNMIYDLPIYNRLITFSKFFYNYHLFFQDYNPDENGCKLHMNFTYDILNMKNICLIHTEKSLGYNKYIKSIRNEKIDNIIN